MWGYLSNLASVLCSFICTCIYKVYIQVEAMVSILTHVPSSFFSGVQLYSHTLDLMLANNSVISSSDIGGANSQSLSCHTAAGDSLFIPTESKWIDINGDNIEKKRRSEANNDVFYTQLRVKRRDLNRGGVEFTSEHEGVYTCHINDENGDRQTMYIGIYTPETIANTGQYLYCYTYCMLHNIVHKVQCII